VGWPGQEKWKGRWPNNKQDAGSNEKQEKAASAEE
jgi:hypothetical protein